MNRQCSFAERLFGGYVAAAAGPVVSTAGVTSRASSADAPGLTVCVDDD